MSYQCPRCGSPLKGGEQFCPKCGVRLSYSGQNNQSASSQLKIYRESSYKKSSGKKIGLIIAAIVVVLLAVGGIFIYRWSVDKEREMAEQRIEESLNPNYRTERGRWTYNQDQGYIFHNLSTNTYEYLSSPFCMDASLLYQYGNFYFCGAVMYVGVESNYKQVKLDNSQSTIQVTFPKETGEDNYWLMPVSIERDHFVMRPDIILGDKEKYDEFMEMLLKSPSFTVKATFEDGTVYTFEFKSPNLVNMIKEAMRLEANKSSN